MVPHRRARGKRSKIPGYYAYAQTSIRCRGILSATLFEFSVDQVCLFTGSVLSWQPWKLVVDPIAIG